MAKKQSRNFYSGGRYGSRYKTTVTMGKMFTTKAGRYGCYVYINGRRSHFEPKAGYNQAPGYYKAKRRK